MKSLERIFFKPTDIAFLVYFRVFAGGFIAGEVINQLFTGDYLNYIKPAFNFTYQFFPWVRPFPETGMYILFAVIVLSAIMVLLGWKYRIGTVILFLSYTAMFLMEKSEYVNHFYLYCIITFLLIFLPAHGAFSLDARKAEKQQSAVPAWNYYLLLFMIGVVYFYAGIAKLHTDWFSARAMSIWMGYKGDIPVVGPLLTTVYAPWALSYGGFIFDLLIVPALIWKKSRMVAFYTACFFHMSNVIIFGLATFPWFSLMMTTLYFGPSWARKLPVLKTHLPESEIEPLEIHSGKKKLTVTCLLIFAVLNLLIPFRHFLYPESPNWTEEGHRFSWHMMLRSKSSETTFIINADDKVFAEFGNEYLTPHQISKMGGDPDMILEFAHFLRDEFRKKGFSDISVRVNALVSLNGRTRQLLVNPDTELAKEKRSLCHYSWIVPLKD